MKKLFRKATTVVGSAILIGATVGMASAAYYLEPFLSNTAIVVGANAAPSDNIAAASISTLLNARGTAGEVYVDEGRSYKFEKPSTKFHIGDRITDVISSSLDEDEMPVLLDDGTFIDSKNDQFDFTQEITMGDDVQLTMFDNNDYRRDDPSLGFEIKSGTEIFTYSLDFTDEPFVDYLEESDLIMMGREYYVLSAEETKLVLLDAAADGVLSEGETVTVLVAGKSYTVSLDYVSRLDAKLVINGEVTNTFKPGETYKLIDGAYVGLKEILYNEKDVGISKVEISLGKGKLTLKNDSEVELNEKSIDDLTVIITNGNDSGDTTLESVNIKWEADDDIFIAKDTVATMPGFRAVTLTFTGVDFPMEEEIVPTYDGLDSVRLFDFPTTRSTDHINLLYMNRTDGSFIGIGEDDDERLATGVYEVEYNDRRDDMFIMSWEDTQDTESYIMDATGFSKSSGQNRTTLRQKIGGVWSDYKTDVKEGDTFSLGSAELEIGPIDNDNKTIIIYSGGVETTFNTLYSKGGLKVELPTENDTAQGYINFSDSPTEWILYTTESDKDGNIAEGNTINVTFGSNSDVEASVILVEGRGSDRAEIGDTDVYRSFVHSAVGTEILEDTGDDQDWATLVYHGSESPANVYISSTATLTEAVGVGIMTIMDRDVSTVTGKNLIVVGGSAINSLAAEVLGGSYRTKAFTDATGVTDGEFLIQSFGRGGNIALLVAGYNADDTEKGVTYFLNNEVDVNVGTKMIGTSATEASLIAKREVLAT